VLVARPAAGAAPAGYMLAAKSARPGEGWILSAATHPAWRGRGIGQALLQQLLATLDAAGLTEIRLTVHPGNTVACRLYERAGFVCEARDEAYFGPDQPRLIMVRRKPV
jgi:ribosomal-protein-alanine N-acetyltransferase